jgi:hypothetical protein
MTEDIEPDYNDQMIFFMEKIPLVCSRCGFKEEVEWSFQFYCIKQGYLKEIPLLCPKCTKEKQNEPIGSKITNTSN